MMKILSNKTNLKLIDIFVLFKICFEKNLIILIQHKRLYITRIQPGVNQTWLIHIGHQNSGVFPKKKKTINSFENKKQNLLYSLSLDNPSFAPFLSHDTKSKEIENQRKSRFQERQQPGPRKETTDDPTEIYYAGSYARSDCQVLPCHISFCEKPYVTGADMVVYFTTFRFLNNPLHIF